MRRTLTASAAIALMTGTAMWFVTIAGAQSGGTIEAKKISEPVGAGFHSPLT